ncbi:MAG: hypothetical protein WBZ32_04705 [Candidatus Acidiferrales bacterium]
MSRITLEELHPKRLEPGGASTVIFAAFFGDALFGVNVRRSFIIPSLILALVLSARVTPARQASTTPAGTHGTLDVRLKLPDGERFSGVATIHLLASGGSEVANRAQDTGGQARFTDLEAGKYIVEVTAPGFVTERQTLEISVRQISVTAFLTMTPEASQASVVLGSLPTPISETTTIEEAQKSIAALEKDDAVPPALSGAACPLPLVLKAVGQSAEELVNNLERFSATERVEHFAVNARGEVRAPEVRSFEYVVVVSRGLDGDFLIDEYRDGEIDPGRFPAGIATMGLPALALIFHPKLASEFNFTCDGMAEYGGRPVWVVHFEQRADRPNRIRSYVVNKNTHGVPLKGLAMIDAGTFQVARLETELVKPVSEIKLTQERIAIDYALVQFHTNEQELWLPKSAELYVEINKDRYYRRHTFSNFHVFTVGTNQKIRAPKESYAFTNTSNQDISGILTVSPIPGQDLHQVSITFRIPAGRTVFKVVGPGKDINFPVEDVGSARFAHTGPPGSIDANAYFVKASTLELVPGTAIPPDATN